MEVTKNLHCDQHKHHRPECQGCRDAAAEFRERHQRWALDQRKHLDDWNAVRTARGAKLD